MPEVTHAAVRTTPLGIGGWLWIPAGSLAFSVLNSAFEAPARISAFFARDADRAPVFFLYDVAFPAFLVWAAYSFVRRPARTRALMGIGLRGTPRGIRSGWLARGAELDGGRELLPRARDRRGIHLLGACEEDLRPVKMVEKAWHWSTAIDVVLKPQTRALPKAH